MSAALDYHRATNYAEGDWENDEEARYVGERPPLFKEYDDADRLPLEASVAGPLLDAGAGVVRSQQGRDYGGGTIHWRAYSSAGALYPVEAYVAAPDGLFSFHALSRTLVRVAGGDARARVAGALAVDSGVDAFVVLTGIHGRTGWKYLERGYRHVWWDAGTMLANLLALAGADGLRPRLYTAFVDDELNDVLGVDGETEYALAVLALGDASALSPAEAGPTSAAAPPAEEAQRYPLALRLHRDSALRDAAAVRAWRVDTRDDEPAVDRDALAAAIRRRRSVRSYADVPLPRDALARLLAWSEAPIPADAPSVVRQAVAVAAVEGLEPGTYDASLELVRALEAGALRERVWFAAMEQDHARDGAVNVFQLADVERVVDRLGDRGYRWAQLEAGIRAGRLQVGAFMHGWGAAASTFYDDIVSELFETSEAPLLMVALGAVPARG